MNTKPLHQVILLVAAAAPPAATVTVTSAGPTSTVTAVVRSTVTVSPDDRMADSTSFFVSPSGRIACMMVSSTDNPTPSSFWVRCDYLDADRGWTTPKPKNCQFHGGDTLFLLDTAQPGCVSEAGYVGAIMYPMYQGHQMWWHYGDPTVRKYGEVMAALPYGAVLQVGMARCAMETTGVTCTNLVTGHGIVVSQSRYGMF